LQINPLQVWFLDMSSFNSFDSSSSSSSDDDGGAKLIYKTAVFAAITYEAKRIMSLERTSRWGGSVKGRKYIHRNNVGAHKRLKEDYFDDDCTYPDEHFRRRFRMNRELFMRIHDAVVEHDPVNFKQRRDAAKKLGLSSLQKITAAIRILAYGMSGDICDDYLKLAGSTAIKCMKDFCIAVIEIFGNEYLRNPTKEDIERILVENASRGFPGMLGSLDCMHWKWKNCPTAWHGSHVNGKIGAPTLILEAVATRNLWIWHCFFGMAGTNNDLNVLDNSHLFDGIISGDAPTCNYIINGHTYTMAYY